MSLKRILKSLKLSEQTISTALGALVVIVVGILIFSYFRGSVKKTTPEETSTIQQEETQPAEEEKEFKGTLPTTHKVGKGEHLWKIALKYYGSGYNWVDIANENKLARPSLIYTGQDLIIPDVEVRKPVAAEKLAAKAVSPIEGTTYTAVNGDNLWMIAVRAYGDGYKWIVIAKANKLVHPSLIHAGNVLTLSR